MRRGEASGAVAADSTLLDRLEDELVARGVGETRYPIIDRAADLAVAIPQDLRDRRQWVVYRVEERDGQPTKVPYRADDPHKRASTTDASTWATFEDALPALAEADGLGYVFAREDEFCGVDLDGCLDDEERLDSTAAAIVARLDSYTERSPSGRGLHAIVRASLTGDRRRGRLPSGVGFECYSEGRYFTMTGDRLRGTPAGIESRQAEVEDVLALVFPPAEPAGNGAGPAPSREPLALDDEELLARAFAARNGGELRALYEGTGADRYPSRSEADLALVGGLAFWTGPDEARLDALYRRSALMRPKWDSRRGSTTYGAETIRKALEGRREFYKPGVDADPPSGDGAAPERSRLRFVPVGEFAERADEPAVPAIGEPGNTLLPVGGLLIMGGEGGASKTTLTLDAVAHLASGTAWLGFPVPRPLRVAIIEAEGPRPQFREKLAAKLDAWEGRPWRSNVLVLEEPWAAFSFASAEHRAALREFCRAEAIDAVVADPLDALGIEGAGKPEETRRFVAWLRECGLHSPTSPLAFWILHHYAKAPQRSVVAQLSGAWGGHPDAILGVELGGANATKLTWAKLRWATPPADKVAVLEWDLPARGFRLVEPQPAPGAEELLEAVVAYVTAHPGAPQSEVEDEVHGGRSAVRKALLLGASDKGGNRLALGPGRAWNGRYFYPADHPALRSPGEPEASNGEPFALPVEGTPLAARRSPVGGRASGASERTGHEPEGSPRGVGLSGGDPSENAAREAGEPA